jgi:hypothetical protein
VHHTVRHTSVRREVVYQEAPVVVREPVTVYREAPPPVIYDEVDYAGGPVWYGGPRHMFGHGWHEGWRHGYHDFDHRHFHDWR